MPGTSCEDLTTLLIFEELVYQREALCVPGDKSEDDLDEIIASEARESGIEDPYRYLGLEFQDVSTALSTVTVSSEQRSSISIHSQESQSTGITSHPSRSSRDDTSVEPQSTLRTTVPTLPRASLCPENYDSILERSRPTFRHTRSTSTTSTTASTLSTSSWTKTVTAKRKQRPSLLSIFKKESSSTCTSKSRHNHPKSPFMPMLDCGHTLTKDALRVHIREALESGEHLSPNCCGRPLPKAVLRMVLNKDEMDNVMADLMQFPGLEVCNVTTLDSDYTTSPTSPTQADFPSSDEISTGADVAPRDMSREDAGWLTNVFANEAFTILRKQQQEQFRRISKFELRQRQALIKYHQWSESTLKTRLKRRKSEKIEQHVLELERLEESQVVAEHDLRKAQAQETQNVATALKYMKAYCGGVDAVNPEVKHVVTEDDVKKLRRQYATQANLPHKHESVINVLRAKQEKEVKTKLHKQQTELLQMDVDFEKENRALGMNFLKETSRLDALIESRRKRILARWDLRFEIWRKDFEAQHETPLEGRLPHAEWPHLTKLDEPLDDSSKLAPYFLLGTATT